MYCAVSCSCPALYVNLRLLLHAFHANKRLREVDAMLLRLYNPIIWRYALPPLCPDPLNAPPFE
jgi:hypothetical protein